MGREGKMGPHFQNGMGFFYFSPPGVKRREGVQSIFCPPTGSYRNKDKKTKYLKECFAWHMDCCLLGRGEVFHII